MASLGMSKVQKWENDIFIPDSGTAHLEEPLLKMDCFSVFTFGLGAFRKVGGLTSGPATLLFAWRV